MIKKIMRILLLELQQKSLEYISTHNLQIESC